MSRFWRAFFEGLGSAFNFLPPRRIRYPYRTEAEALRSDWQKVGDDMRQAIRDAGGK